MLRLQAMEIRVHAPHVRTDGQELEALVDRALGRFAERLVSVEVFLRDENGAKGGLDKHCKLEARPRGLDPLVAGHQAATAVEAVAGAAGRLERLLERRFGRLSDAR